MTNHTPHLQAQVLGQLQTAVVTLPLEKDIPVGCLGVKVHPSSLQTHHSQERVSLDTEREGVKEERKFCGVTLYSLVFQL